MKLLRIGEPGQERPALLDDTGTLRDLGGSVTDITGNMLSPASLDTLRMLDPAALPPMDIGRIGPCVATAPNFYCVGLNYAKHATEAGMDAPKEPILFSKASSAICGPNDPLTLPPASRKSDWEVELGVIIGQIAYQVPERAALSYVAGYCTINDLSERSFQLERGGQWIKGKSAPNFGPVGPWLVTADDIPDPQALPLSLRLNGDVMQNSTTADMIFSVAEIISYMSRFMVLQPGDIIATGTPSGVGMGLTPQRFLKPGDRMEATVAGLGTQNQTVLASEQGQSI